MLSKQHTDNRTLTPVGTNVRITPKLREHIEEIARENGDTLSATIRSLLRDGIEQRSQGGR